MNNTSDIKEYLITQEQADRRAKSLWVDIHIQYKKLGVKTIPVPAIKGSHPVYGCTFPKDSSSVLDHE